MLKFITSLFTAPTRTPRRRTQLALDVMEDRYAPAGVTNPGLIRGFNPQPDPPGLSTSPSVVREISPQLHGIGTSPSGSRG